MRMLDPKHGDSLRFYHSTSALRERVYAYSRLFFIERDVVSTRRSLGLPSVLLSLRASYIYIETFPLALKQSLYYSSQVTAPMVDLSTATPVGILDESDGLISISSQGGLLVTTTANTEAAKSWSAVKVDWHGPVKDLVLIIETPYTERQQPFTVVLHTQDANGFHFLQIIDGEEIDMTDDGGKIQMDCDSNYQVILKVSDALEGSRYMISFRYIVIPK